MSRTVRKPYHRTGKEIGRGECPEWFRIKQTRGHVKNSFFDDDTKEEIWAPKMKKRVKKDSARKERRKQKIKLKKYN